jgi:hypothetical protein
MRLSLPLLPLILESAKEAFMSELQANPEKGAELAQTLISRLQPGSTVGAVMCIIEI